MEFQMRNKTFISSMVLSVACVSAANAGVVDPFTDAQTPPPYDTFTNITGGLFEQRALANSGGGSGSVSGGFVNFVPRSFWMVYKQANGSSIDLSGITSMSFDITAVGTYELQWVITDSNGIAIDYEVGVSAGSTTLTFAPPYIGTGENLGFNMASIKMMEVKFVSGSSGSTGQISNFNYTGVPAPGALALLGVAGIVGARRRRD
jgi:MYXO-CTERM domain-containing protein